MSPLPASQLIDLGRALYERCGTDVGGTVDVKAQRVISQGHLPLVFGLSQHCLQLGTVTPDLYDQDRRLEAMPTIRAMFELAVTTSWASDSREAVLGMFNKDHLDRRNLSKTMAQAASALFREEADSLVIDLADRIETIADAQARSFEQRCNALSVVGADGYALYRIMSAFCHPSPMLADRYVKVTETPQLAMELMRDPEQFDYDSWLHLAVSSMVWSARAFDVMTRSGPHRNYLRDIARQLGIPDVLRLSHDARQAEAKADQTRRRAAYKPPRRRRTPGKTS